MAVTSDNYSSINLEENCTLNANGINGKGAVAGSNGTININNGTINVSGQWGYGIFVYGENTKLNMTSGTINVTGNDSTGLSSNDKGEIHLQGTSKVNVSGNQSTALGNFDFGKIFVKDSPVIEANGNNGIGACSSNGGNIDIQGSPIISATGDWGAGIIVGTGGNMNIQGGRINAKKFGLNVYSEDKQKGSKLNMSSSVQVNVADEDGLGLIIRGEGATAKIGDLTINAPKEEFVEYGTPFNLINFEQYIPYTPDNLQIYWNSDDYNEGLAKTYEVCGVVNWPNSIKINRAIFMFKNVTVNYSGKDVNHDGIVDTKDLLLISDNYNLTPSAPNSQLDLNGDNIIDIFDLIIASKKIN